MNLVYLKACRLCAASCENTIAIFEKTGIVDLAAKIKSYLHVEIKNLNDSNDEPRMCNACYKKIVSWDRYVEQVRKVQGMFLLWTDMKDNRENNKTVEKLCGEVKSEEITLFRSEEKPERSSSTVQHKEIKIENDYSDFSDEDDIPLADQFNASADPGKSKLKTSIKKKKVKPKIKLKIKAVKKEETKKDEEDENFKEDLNVKSLESGYSSIDESRLNSRDENSAQQTEPLPLFTWECLECHVPVKNWNALVKHCKDVHKSNASVQCVCGKVLQSRASIVKHRMKHTVGYGYKCEFENCNKTFHRQHLLDVHSLSHMPKELQPWMCCKCSRRFHTESLLKQHEKVHLPKEEKLIHPCEVCQKKFCSKSAVASHIRAVHFGERPFVCDQCGHSFTSKGILHEHLTIHSDVYNFHCKDCKKSFKTKYRLKIHMDTHVETRYQCPVCTLTLNTRRTLRMHLLVHRDDKAFQCTTCGKAFKRSKDLKNHYNLHTGRRPYTCPFCQRTFANGSNCRSHKRRMHPEELKSYEAALAAGQQPAIPAPEGSAPPRRPPGFEFSEDSNESESYVSDSKYPKYSDEEEAKGQIRRVDGYGAILGGEPPRDAIKRENEEEDAGGQNAPQAHRPPPAANAADTFYSFQSSGIPAFPGNPFYRQ